MIQICSTQHTNHGQARRFIEEMVTMRKVERFLLDIISNSMTVAEHFRRIAPIPSDIAYTLRRFAAREASKKRKSSSDVIFAQLYRAFEFKGRCRSVIGQYDERRKLLSQKCRWYEGCCPFPYYQPPPCVMHTAGRSIDIEHELWVSNLNPDDSDDESYEYWVNDEDGDEIEHEDMNLNGEFVIADDELYNSDDESTGDYNDMNFLDGGLVPLAANSTQLPIIDDIYRPVDLAESELTDQEFLIKTLRPLTAHWPNASMYMGFDLNEEDYVTDSTECDDGEYSILLNAPLIVNMLKRATYAFAVGSVRESIGWLHPEPEKPKVTDREKQLQLEIAALKEQLKYSKIIPTVDLTGDNEEASDTEAPSAAANASCSGDESSVLLLSGPNTKRRRTESEQNSGRVTRRTASRVQVKREDIKAGDVNCPAPNCDRIISHNGGCNILICREHRPHWVYFCAHCQEMGEQGSEIIRCALECPRRNTQADRDLAQTLRNKRAREYPVVL